MSYAGDFALGSTFDVGFTSRRFTTGAPFTLAGSPAVAAYPDNSTTEITAGITLSVDFDSRTGLNNVRVVATSGNGYAAGSNYKLVITSGTVDSVSVVGEVIGSFSIEARSALRPSTVGRTLAVESDGMAHADLKEINGGATDGNNAVLSLKQLNIVNDDGSALVAQSTGSNGHGIAAQGHGTGDGVRAFGGATGHGLDARGGTTSGAGILAIGAGAAGDAVPTYGSNQGSGIYARARGFSDGIEATGGADEGDGGGQGIFAMAGTGSNLHGLGAAGDGTGAGMAIQAGATGHGVQIYAAGGVGAQIHAEDNHGINVLAGGDGSGLRLVGGVAGHGIQAVGVAGILGESYYDGWGGITGYHGGENGAGIMGRAEDGVGIEGQAVAGSDIKGNIDGTIGGANVTSIAGSTDAAERQRDGALALGYGVVDTGATTAVIPTKSLHPTVAAANQFSGRRIVFRIGTATAALKGQAASIASMTDTGVITLVAAHVLTTAPAEDDEFDVF